jgi:hypothetical protein
MIHVARIALVAVAAIALAGCNSGSSSFAASAPIPAIIQREAAAKTEAVWTPDAKLVDELAPAVEVDRFQFRPPKNFSRVTSPLAPAGGKIFTFQDSNRGQAFPAHIIITLITLPPNEPKVDADHALSQTLTRVRNSHFDTSETDREYGQINGLKFVRVSWTGRLAIGQSARNWRGSIWSGKADDTNILIRFEDLAPRYDQSAKSAEAAILTFRIADAAK